LVGEGVQEMEKTSDITINFEAQLVSTSMTANGGHKVTLRINPEDVLDSEHIGDAKSNANGRVRSLMTQSPNTRYMCVLVELAEEDDSPVIQPDVAKGVKAINKFSVLCRQSAKFQRWLGADNEGEAVRILKNRLSIESRKDLATSADARSLFFSILDDYYEEILS
jgi:hypothetical protein